MVFPLGLGKIVRCFLLLEVMQWELSILSGRQRLFLLAFHCPHGICVDIRIMDQEHLEHTFATTSHLYMNQGFTATELHFVYLN